MLHIFNEVEKYFFNVEISLYILIINLLFILKKNFFWVLIFFVKSVYVYNL